MKELRFNSGQKTMIAEIHGQGAIIFPPSWKREVKNQSFLWKINTFDQANGVFIIILKAY